MIDLTPACQRTAEVLMNVTDAQLNGRTPCQKLSLRDLVGMWVAWRWHSPRPPKRSSASSTDTPPVEGAPLDDDWRTAYPRRLAELARAWGEPAAWEGMSRTGGVDFPGEMAGIVARRRR